MAVATSSETLSLPSVKVSGANIGCETSELFDLLHRLQSARLDDQRCLMPDRTSDSNTEGSTRSASTSTKSVLEEILRKANKPYPMIVLPKNGGYWLDPPPPSSDPLGLTATSTSSSTSSTPAFELDESARCYRAHFMGYEHLNLHGFDHLLGPVVLSLKSYTDLSNTSSSGDRHTRAILRLQSGTKHKVIADASVPALRAAQLLEPNLSLDRLQPVLCPRASELIVDYDEHVLDNVFKFGLVYQRCGQITEEALFGNRVHSSSMDEFMDMLGRRVNLSEHKGYSGGLDTRFGQTGSVSLYETFHGREIMFHVSTLLPHADSDSQQLQKKRHIGNDIVALVFQDGDTPFTPDMITSHFLHAFIIVQPVVNGNRQTRTAPTTHYKISVTARSDVPYFGPALPSPAIMEKGPDFKRFLLTKLVNAQNACLKADEFAKLEQRTRATLLANLEDELAKQTETFINNEQVKSSNEARSNMTEGGGGEGRRQSRLMETVKKALAGRTRSQQAITYDVEQSHQTPKLTKSRSSSSNLSLHSASSTSGLDKAKGINKTALRTATETSGSGQTMQRQVGGLKSDSGRGSVGSGSTGRGSTAGSPISSPDTPVRVESQNNNSVNNKKSNKLVGSMVNESDDSSLNSVDLEQNSVNNRRPMVATVSQVVSGPVTTVTLSGGPSALERYQDEISRLRVEKLELLRQHVNAQREVKRLREREVRLQAELTQASNEIHRLREHRREESNPERKSSAPIV